MAKVKYDVSDAEVRNFEVPKPGVYEAHIHEASHGQSSSDNPMFTIVFEVTKGDHKGARIWHYILTDGSQDWRLREFTDALGLKPKGAVEPADLVGSVVQLRTAIDPAKDGYDEKARVKNVMPPAGTDGASAGEDDDDDEPYEEWDIGDLKEELEARELKVAGRATKAKIIAALEADDAEDEGEDEEEEEEKDEEKEDEEDEDGISMADLKKMSRTELKGVIKEEELEVKVLKKDSDDALREKIAEALELEDEEEEGEEEEEEEGSEEDTDYEEWDISELKAELKERALKTDGRKSVLVARLKKDDTKDEEPF